MLWRDIGLKSARRGAQLAFSEILRFEFVKNLGALFMVMLGLKVVSLFEDTISFGMSRQEAGMIILFSLL